MSYDFTPRPDYAPCLVAFLNAVKAHPRFSALTNLGIQGDAAHQAQGSDSDHNKWLFDLYRACDLGGDLALLTELRDWLNVQFARGDHRLSPQGYTNGPDEQITDWDNPGRLHYSGNDVGHLHVSFSRDRAGCLDAGPWNLPGATPAQPKEWDEMATQDEIKALIDERLAWHLQRLPAVIGTGRANAAFPGGLPGGAPLHDLNWKLDQIFARVAGGQVFSAPPPPPDDPPPDDPPQ